MKNTILKNILAIFMAFIALPMMGQDYMNIYFKDGSSKKFYLDKLVKFSTLKVGADGLPTSDYMSHQIVTENGEYLFNLSEIDSIRFTKISKKQLNHNYKSALEVVLPALSECKTATDAESQLEIIKKTESVEDAWCDDTNCFIKIKDGETISFHFSHIANEDETDSNRLMEQVRNCLKGLKDGIKPNGETIKVAIIFQMLKDESRTKYITKYIAPLEKELESAGIQADKIDSLTIDFFYSKNTGSKHKNIFDYDLTFLITHGDYNEDSKTHNILLSTELGNEKKKYIWSDWSSDMEDACHKNLEIYRDTVLNGFISDMDCVTVGYVEEVREGDSYWVGYVNLSENFFSDKPGAQFVNPKSILFSGACQTLKNSDSFANTLVEKQKLGVYLGYNETTFLSEQTGYEWFHAILSGKSIWKAYEDIPEEHRIESFNWNDPVVSLNYVNAHLLFRTKNNDYFSIFLLPTITETIDQTEAQTCFDRNGYVEVKGYATSLDSESISMGFMYATDESLSSPIYVNVEEDVVEFTKPLDNGYGNLSFRGKITDLSPGTNYYYCAFTHDGMYYNCGDTCSFFVFPSLTLSVNKISIKEGSSSTIDITSGSGTYSIEKIEPEGVVTASVSENTISIETFTAGAAIITVKDDKSGQTATIEVTVTENSYLTCPDDHHPHLIDLGLPSGTKWACCNVDTEHPDNQSPTNYGGYYAWGETEVKTIYDYSTYIHCDGSMETCHDIGSDIAGTQYDVAHVKWGGDWIMPTFEELIELHNNCTSEETTLNGVKGRQYTGTNGSSIFLPFAGAHENSSFIEGAKSGYYWSSTLHPSRSYCAYFCYLSNFYTSDYCYEYYYHRFVGLSVRPVVSN